MQIIVYTGAVLMLFLFVLMIVGVSSADSLRGDHRGQRLWRRPWPASRCWCCWPWSSGTRRSARPRPPDGRLRRRATCTGIATLIFTRYVFPFEVTSALLITAALGAMVLAHRERTTPKPTQRDLSRRGWRARSPTPLPGPGTYARHNAVDMPALLPDGTPSALSVSPVISGRARRTGGGQRGAPEAAGALPPARAGTARRAGPVDDRHPAGEAERQRAGGGAVMSPGHYVALAVILFVIGAVGVLVRRNAMVIFMCVELMLNAVNLAFVAFARQHGNLDGQVIAFFVMVVAAAEVVVGLAILMAIFRTRRSASVDDANLLKY